MKPTLLVLAAGMGSRYGGLKQIDPIGPNGEILIDYSIYDALEAGFGKVVFIIRHSFEEEFREVVSGKFEGKAEIDYVFQELDALPHGLSVPEGREKPWGTGHAIMLCEEAIQEPFAVINADDFYGSQAFKLQKNFLTSVADPAQPEYSMVGFILGNTLSDHGSVCRGVCELNGDGTLIRVVEHTGLHRNGAGVIGETLTGTKNTFTGDETVSMNLWGFTPAIFRYLRREFVSFFEEYGREMKSEIFIPGVVDTLVSKNEARVKVLRSHDMWFGVTYREDKEFAVARVRELIDAGQYPEKLWG